MIVQCQCKCGCASEVLDGRIKWCGKCIFDKFTKDDMIHGPKQ